MKHPSFTTMTEFLGELLNFGILDSGCTQTVCGQIWLDVYRKSLPEELNSKLIMGSSSRVFKFGDGDLIKSIGKIKIPINIEGVKNVWIETDVIKKDLPLLISRESMKMANTVISFNEEGKEKVTMFGKAQKLYVSASGHLCLPVAKYNVVMEEEACDTILFTGTVSSMTKEQKKRIAKKLHEQFAHPIAARLIKLLKDGGVDDK